MAECPDGFYHSVITGERPARKGKGKGGAMHIVTILGSYRKKGSTAAVLGWVEAELESLGHTVERITLNKKTVGGCLGCAKCRENPDDIACVQQDDAGGILQQMVAADRVLFSSPVYFWGFSAQLKALIDRCYALVTRYNKPGHTSLMAGKRVGLLVTGADAYENNAEGLFTAFDRFAGFLLADKAGELYVGGCHAPADLTDDAKAMAVELARSLTAS